MKIQPDLETLYYRNRYNPTSQKCLGNRVVPNTDPNSSIPSLDLGETKPIEPTDKKKQLKIIKLDTALMIYYYNILVA